MSYELIQRGRMNYTKMIVCLANSYKHEGRCIAGKEIVFNHDIWNISDWVRPVSNRQSREINNHEKTYQCSASVEKMDAMAITFSREDDHVFQKENHIILHPPKWEKKFTITPQQLVHFLDNPLELWSNTDSSYSGLRDRIPVENLTKKSNSLYFIEPEFVRIKISAEGAAFGDQKRTVRAKFQYNNIEYWLTVTDPELKNEYLNKNNGEYDANDIRYLTISLGEIHQGYSYKLVAGAFK